MTKRGMQQNNTLSSVRCMNKFGQLYPPTNDKRKKDAVKLIKAIQGICDVQLFDCDGSCSFEESNSSDIREMELILLPAQDLLVGTSMSLGTHGLESMKEVCHHGTRTLLFVSGILVFVFVLVPITE